MARHFTISVARRGLSSPTGHFSPFLTLSVIEARVGLADGNIRHLDLMPGQLLGRRPLPDWAHCRTPLAGLYLCGAGTHPGGEVTGAPGYNAARAILGDLLRDVADGA
jgi:phytoene dehydrogenase-like protein